MNAREADVLAQAEMALQAAIAAVPSSRDQAWIRVWREPQEHPAKPGRLRIEIVETEGNP